MNIQKLKLKDLDLNDSFFDSLKNDYANFNIWFSNHLERDCYVVFNKSIKALLILKEEIYNNKRILKICTFKVEEINKGIATSFINIINEYLFDNNIKYVYFTIYDKYNSLINYFIKRGFIKYKEISNESIYYKEYNTILLPIKIEHASKIVNNTKKYEYRKIMPKKNINRMIVYATSPTKKIIGEVMVLDIIIGNKEDIWSITKDDSNTSKDIYDRYYKNNNIVVAYKLGKVIKYEKDLKDIGINHVPESFVYVR